MLLLILHYELFWGFAVGFLVSTVVHGFLITDSPRAVLTILLHDKAKSFTKLHKIGDNGQYNDSFCTFSAQTRKMKTVFAITGALFLFLIILALLTF